MKRFTETEKWRDSWFRKLVPSLKLGYLFVLDHCNAAGVWDADFDVGDFHIGEKVDWPALKIELGPDRLEILQSGKWHLKKFIKFQWGELSPDCKQHQHVIRLVKEYALEQKTRKPKESLTPVPTLANRAKEQRKEQDQKQEKTREQLRAEKLFKRKPETAWDSSCKIAWEKSKAVIVSTTEDDWTLIEWFYSIPSEGTYRRHDLPTLLNNWTAEIDRARNHKGGRGTTEKQRLPDNVREILSAQTTEEGDFPI